MEWWISILTSLLTPTIAAVTTSIVVLQYLLARRARNLRLYEMRSHIYKHVSSFLLDVVYINNGVTFEEVTKFSEAVCLFPFLFKKDEDIRKFIRDIEQRAYDMYRLRMDFQFPAGSPERTKKLLFPPKEAPSPRELTITEQVEFLRKHVEFIEWFCKQLAALSGKFHKYLDVD